MSFVVGYRGAPVFESTVIDDPRKSVADPDVHLTSEEVDSMMAGTEMGWDDLNPSQQREVARMILLNRTDDMSRLQLQQLGLNIPKFNSFTIEQVESTPEAPAWHSYFLQ